MAIAIFVTGGTFDKEYNELKGELYFRDTHVPEILRLGRCKVEIRVTTLMMIDSLHMTATHRKIILHNCQMAKEEHILITHGTDTMVETARYLAKGLKDKTVVLTGAIVPYRFGSSDGLFNMGGALAFVQTLPPGVYVSMNGKCFSWKNVRKNKSLGEFEEIKSGSRPARR